MTGNVSVAILPKLITPTDLSQSTVIVTDVLRASTTIIAALSNGARDIVPVAEIATALALRAGSTDLPFGRRLPRTDCPIVLGGERRGVIIPGFDQGNSPLEFTPEVVANKRLVLCTTNGTVAIEHCRGAKRILIGALVNVGAIAAEVADEANLCVVCAGTAGHVTAEDVLFAGAFIDRLQIGDSRRWNLDDQAILASDLWRGARERVQAGVSLSEQLAQSRGGRNLMELGYREDVEFCGQIDRLPIVPELDQEQWVIRGVAATYKH